MPIEANHNRRRFQLSLATIMLLMAVAAIAVAWWADHARLVKQLEASDAEIRVYVLQYADAANIAASLQILFPPNGADPTRIACDNRTNGLIVAASPARMQAIKMALLRLDRQIEGTPSPPAEP